MLLITQGVQTNIIVTLTESVTVQSPTYLFTFTNITTNEVVTFETNSSADLSNYPNRYNEFVLSSSLFQSVKIGQWHYKVVEVESGNTLEIGKMLLQKNTLIQRNGYTAETVRSGYSG